MKKITKKLELKKVTYVNLITGGDDDGDVGKEKITKKPKEVKTGENC